MREKQAMALAKKQVLNQDYDVDTNFLYDSETQKKHGFQNRKGSHDGREKGQDELGAHHDYTMGKKRKSQDERTSELVKAKNYFMKQTPSNLLSEDKRVRNQAFIEGFTKNDLGLRGCGFGFEFSGTTIVTVMVQGNKLVTANAGDSRAVIGALKDFNYDLKDKNIESKALSVEENDKIWVAKQITRDHKPDDEDEKERILKQNGRIESYKGRYGENVGPARVWLKTEQYPGLAMSRSIGDACAHSVGVSHIPEMKQFMMDEDDKFLILASDGVWEFLSNDEVLDLVVPFWHQNDLKGACNTIVKESVAAWEREEDSIDDITVIVVFFKRSPVSSTDSGLVFNEQRQQEDSAFKSGKISQYMQNQQKNRQTRSRENSLTA